MDADGSRMSLLVFGKGDESMSYIYLHGFASSPQSAKSQYLCRRFAEVGINLITPDMNLGDFSRLSLTRQLAQVEQLKMEEPVMLIGSSFGGLTAAWLAQRQVLPVSRLVLLAPAFQFLCHWLPKLGAENLAKWQQQGYWPVYHYGNQCEQLLGYDFVMDLEQYADAELMIPIPTLILHGRGDEVIPISSSREFAKQRDWVKLVELESDHSLGNVMGEIWQAIADFGQIPSEKLSN